MKERTQKKGNYRSFSILTVGALLVFSLSACELFGYLEPDRTSSELIQFSNCASLETYLKSEALRTARIISGLNTDSSYQPHGFMGSGTTGGSSSGFAVDPGVLSVTYSDTNNQEADVFEADIFQVDATHAFALRGNNLIIIEALGEATANPGGPLYQIDGGRIVADINIGARPIEMFLKDNLVVVIANARHSDVVMQYGSQGPSRTSSSPVIQALVFDVSNRREPELVREVAVEGDYMGSRRIEDFVYIITTAQFGGPSNDDGPGVAMATEWLNLEWLRIMGANLDRWMPYTYSTSYSEGEVTNQDVARCNCATTYASPAAPGDDTVSIISFNLQDQNSRIETTTIVGDGTLVYASTDSIIVALTNWALAAYDQGGSSTDGDQWGDWGDDWSSWNDWSDWNSWTSNFSTSNDREPVGQYSFLHRFELDRSSGKVTYQATGEVEGWILNQFALSEHDGVVRVATQRNRGQWDAESMLFTLRPRPQSASGPMHIVNAAVGNVDSLEIIGELRNIAVGEDLYAVRFDGDVGYLLTFLLTDPLWIIDLSTPERPRIRGDIQVPGLSTYLHPISGGRLLGIGLGIDDFWGNVLGIKVSLFDVSDMDRPFAVTELIEGGATTQSEATTEHRAFRYLEDRGLLAVPIEGGGAAGLYLYKVESSGLRQAGRITHDSMGGASQIRRSYRIGNYLYSYSHAGVSITNLDNLQTAAEVPFGI